MHMVLENIRVLRQKWFNNITLKLTYYYSESTKSSLRRVIVKLVIYFVSKKSSTVCSTFITCCYIIVQCGIFTKRETNEFATNFINNAVENCYCGCDNQVVYSYRSVMALLYLIFFISIIFVVFIFKSCSSSKY